MTERIPTNAERGPRLNQAAATAAEHAAIESHGEEKKKSLTGRFVASPILLIITGGVFLGGLFLKGVEKAEAMYSKLAGGGGGGGHAPKKAESHGGGGHGGGHH
jgi:hypothetical protein